MAQNLEIYVTYFLNRHLVLSKTYIEDASKAEALTSRNWFAIGSHGFTWMMQGPTSLHTIKLDLYLVGIFCLLPPSLNGLKEILRAYIRGNNIRGVGLYSEGLLC